MPLWALKMPLWALEMPLWALEMPLWTHHIPFLAPKMLLGLLRNAMQGF